MSLLSNLLCVALLAAPFQGPPQRKRETDGNKLVQVALKADRETIRAGESFELCVVLDVKPGWHVYWENAGDAGNPTRVEFAAPKGFEVGDARFPCPVRHEEEGDIVSYVHEGQVLLVADAKAPADLAPGAPLEFRVDVDWLVCTDYCLPGGAKRTLALTAAAKDAETKPANTELFAKAHAALPRAWKDVLGDAQPAFEALDAEHARVTIDVPGAEELEFFPSPSEDTKLVSRARTKTEKGARIVLELEQINGSKDVDYRGVLWIRDAKGAKSCLQEAWRPAKKS